MKLGADEILKIVKDRLMEVGKTLIDKRRLTNKEWTHEIIHQLGQLALNHGFTAYPEFTESGDKRKSSEWLYDLTWCKEDKEEPWAFKGVALTLESEWMSDFWNLNYDFLKLVQAKAEVKVFVCNATSDENQQSLIQNIKNFSPQNVSERYLLAFYQFSRDEPFVYKVYDGMGHEL